MAKVLFMMPRPQEEEISPRLTKQDVRQYHDNDLLQVIVFTDWIMYKRPLTDNEKHNFWLVIDERRERASS